MEEAIVMKAALQTSTTRKKIQPKKIAEQICSFSIHSFYCNEEFDFQSPVTIITGLVKNNNGLPQMNVMVKVLETGGCAKSDQEGRYTILTQVTGELHLCIEQDEIVQRNKSHVIYIPSNHGGMTIQVPDFIWSPPSPASQQTLS